MMFRNNIEPRCAYCKHGIQVSPERVACLNRGVVSLYHSCSKFSYNPLKRLPERPRKLAVALDPELFTL